MSKDKFKVSLRENGEHSFKKSLEAYDFYINTKDKMLLKDTIMFLHHSIELLMKELLVRHSPYLIFEELKSIPQKQKRADKQGLSIFEIDDPPNSVAYGVAISRVEAFLNYPELNDKLIQNLDKLNRLRNQLEHHEIDADREEVERILEAIHLPILNLFEKHLGPLTQLQTPEIKKTWQAINLSAREALRKTHEVYELMQKFNGQNVPGNLLGMDGEIKLPKFDRVIENHTVTIDQGDIHMDIVFDIFAESFNAHTARNRTRWVVDTKPRLTNHPSTLLKLTFNARLINSTPWFVVFDKIPDITQATAKMNNVMFTALEQWEELKKIVESSDLEE